MGYLCENRSFALLTKELHDTLTGFDCQREPAIQAFFREEAILNAQELNEQVVLFLSEGYDGSCGGILCDKHRYFG